jgi:hypothetical protein
MITKRATMPNDTQVVDPMTGRLNPAWVHYFGQLDTLTRLLGAVTLPNKITIESPPVEDLRDKINELISALNGEE